MNALCSYVGIGLAVGWKLYNNGNGMDHSSGTGEHNGVHLCSEWAKSSVLLTYSGQLVASFTVMAKGWFRC